MTVGKYIRKTRKENKLTQDELAKMIGLKHSIISKYENGSVIPNVEVLNKIAVAFNVPPDEYKKKLCNSLISSHDNQETLKNEEINLILLIAKSLIEAEDSPFDENALKRLQSFALAENFRRMWHPFSDPDYFIKEQNYTESKKLLLLAFDSLNEDGQSVAIERIKELAEIKKYQK